MRLHRKSVKETHNFYQIWRLNYVETWYPFASDVWLVFQLSVSHKKIHEMSVNLLILNVNATNFMGGISHK